MQIQLPVYRQIIQAVLAQISVDEPVQGPALDRVLNERFPLGKGGIGHAHRQAQARIREEIDAFYAPRDWSPEPTYGREFV